ncbi:MAG: hypothetical protein M1114_05925 [Candidatus Dependentiae bacterium]|nr:hypothetical protein [Candidatus Dependentiae bacterium]
MKIKNLFLLFLLIPSSLFSENIAFNKVVIWGWKLHSHTHSYIHYAFYKTFKHLGYDTYWFDNDDVVDDFDFDNALFITEGQVDQKIPLRNSSYYILHNCEPKKYQDLIDNYHVLLISVYIHDILLDGRHGDMQKLSDYHYFSIKDHIFYMPWATDLLPHEIDEVKMRVQDNWGHIATKNATWIGSAESGYSGPGDQIARFAQACKNNGINFEIKKIKRWPGAIEPKDNVEFIFNSYLAPALQCQWQVDHGYIPCRIFKNISYGQMGITNSETVYQLFDKKIVYNKDEYQLLYDALSAKKSFTLQQQLDLMDFVKEKHTYINRINDLLYVFSLLNKKETL